MSIGLDTSVVVRLLIGEPRKQAEAARALLDARAAAGEPAAAISDLVVGETYFALLHHYAVPHAEVVASLRALLRDVRVQPTGVALDVLAVIGDRIRGAGLMDRLIHADYSAAGADLVTFDREAARLDGAQLIGGP